VKRLQADLTESERTAFEALLAASNLDELVEIVGDGDEYLEPTFVPKLTRELRAAASSRAFYSGVLHALHRAAHRRLVGNGTAQAEPTWAERLVEIDAAAASHVPAFYRGLIAAVGNRWLDFGWEDARDPSQLSEIRDDLRRIGIVDVELEAHTCSDLASWTLVVCRCLKCKAQVLLAQPHFVHQVQAPLLVTAGDHRCRECGSPALQILMPWVQELPRTDEINALATLVRIGAYRAVYKPPAWGYTRNEHAALLSARANDLVEDVRDQSGALTETITVEIAYSASEFIRALHAPETVDAYDIFAHASGFELEQGTATLEQIARRAEAYAAEHPMAPRMLALGELPWRHVAAALLNEALAKTQTLDAPTRTLFRLETALALAEAHQLAAAEAALIRAEASLADAPNTINKSRMSARVAVVRALILARDGRNAQSQEVLRANLPALTATSSNAEHVMHMGMRRDDAQAMPPDDAIARLTETVYGFVELRAKCYEDLDVNTFHGATIGLSAALANLAFVALEIPFEHAAEFVDSVVAVAMRIDGPLIATIPDQDYRLLARAALRLLSHALSLSRGFDLYAARQRSHASRAFDRLGIHDQAEANRVAALSHALSSNQNRYAGRLALERAGTSVVEESWADAMAMVEVVGLAATRSMIDESSGGKPDLYELSIPACAVAIHCAESLPTLAPRAALVLENQKAAQATNRMSINWGDLPMLPIPSDAAARLQTLLKDQEALRSEAMWPDEHQRESRAALSVVSAEVAKERARIDALRSVTTFLTDSRPVYHLDVSDARACLQRFGSATTLLGIIHSDNLVWAYALWADGCELCKLEDWTSWREDVSEILEAMEQDAPIPASFYDIDKYLLRPLSRRLPELGPDDRLIVSPFGKFARFPFEALRTGQGAVLADVVTVSVTAGLGMLHACVQKPPAAYDAALIVGAPTRTLPPTTKAVRKEIEDVAHLFESQGKTSRVLRAHHAASHEVREYCGAYPVVHFACHGDWGDGSSWPACIFLAEGFDSGVLTAKDIVNGYELQPGALVVIAACESGDVEVGLHHDDNALVHAFMVAGASTVIATRWEIRDEDTAVLIPDFYAQLLSGAAPATALARTIRRARMGVLGPGLDEPNVWAAFSVFGR
jgi:hypothetical protein